MTFDPMQALLGVAVAAAIAFGAHAARMLTRDGAIAATVVGGAAVAGAGWWGGAMLALFFVTSSAHCRLPGDDRANRIAVRGNRRDAVQVVANGGVAAICALSLVLAPRPSAGVLFAGYAGAIAAAAADTWATEIGSRFGGVPRSLRTGRSVPAGTSGAVSLAGSLGALGGATLIGIAVAIGARAGWTVPFGHPLGIIIVAGAAGALADSLLGASLQAAYRCPNCNVPTERRVHCCGASTMLISGCRYVDNDAVNFAATVIGAAVAALLTLGLG
jgi:uncharacterized protein (TIGR00297 family)